MLTHWLIDTSALSRLCISGEHQAWHGRIDRGLVGLCTVSRLEMGFTARSASDWARIMSTRPVTELTLELTTPAIEARAVQIQHLLAERGHHRAVSAVDILTAATAEVARLTVLHVDKDFELIAGVTGQPVERLAVDDEAGGSDRAGGTRGRDRGGGAAAT
jgi:predicted nucleic acid-binding protein